MTIATALFAASCSHKSTPTPSEPLVRFVGSERPVNVGASPTQWRCATYDFAHQLTDASANGPGYVIAAPMGDGAKYSIVAMSKASGRLITITTGIDEVGRLAIDRDHVLWTGGIGIHRAAIGAEAKVEDLVQASGAFQLDADQGHVLYATKDGDIVTIGQRAPVIEHALAATHGVDPFGDMLAVGGRVYWTEGDIPDHRIPPDAIAWAPISGSRSSAEGRIGGIERLRGFCATATEVAWLEQPLSDGGPVGRLRVIIADTETKTSRVLAELPGSIAPAHDLTGYGIATIPGGFAFGADDPSGGIRVLAVSRKGGKANVIASAPAGYFLLAVDGGFAYFRDAQGSLVRRPLRTTTWSPAQ